MAPKRDLFDKLARVTLPEDSAMVIYPRSLVGIDYLRGRDGLFNDRFADGEGYHFTEEIPDPRRKRGLFGRGIEGIVDGLLKGFGL